MLDICLAGKNKKRGKIDKICQVFWIIILYFMFVEAGRRGLTGSILKLFKTCSR
jgi:hypothetical protein